MHNYENGVLTVVTNAVAVWEFEFRDLTGVVIDYNFEVVRSLNSGEVLTFNGKNVLYRIYVNRYDGQGFVSVSSVNGATTLTSSGSSLERLRLTAGRNTVKIVLISHYADGILTKNSRGYWFADVIVGDFTGQYYFRVYNDRFFNYVLSLPYRFYVDVKDGYGFVFRASLVSVASIHPTFPGIPLSRLGLTYGENTVRIISSRQVWAYIDGFVRFGFSTATFVLYKHYCGMVEALGV
ncbi:MAG: hypothetical protein FWB72_05905 [Firmicutes bacterium]|nr:hypothetical protein [Bacillota bacterium]